MRSPAEPWLPPQAGSRPLARAGSSRERPAPGSELHRSRRFLELSTVLLGWLIWGLSYGYASYMPGKGDEFMTPLEHAGDVATKGLVGILVTMALFAGLRRLERARLPRRPAVLAALAIGLACAYGHSFVTITFNFIYWGGRPLLRSPLHYVGGAFAWYLVFAVFTVLYFLIAGWTELEAERERGVRAATLAREARLQMLRYQLNPHFLFNALGTIRSVLYEDRERADRLVRELTAFLRYSLVEEERLEVTLGQELDTIQNYLNIQQVRFEEKLETRIAADARAREWTIPAFLVHPLVENAIKHGMRTSPMPLQVSVEAIVVGDELRIDVGNSGWLRSGNGSESGNASAEGNGSGHVEGGGNGPGEGNPNSTGIGLKNVRLHLEHYFPGRHSFVLEERAGEVHALLTIREEPAGAAGSAISATKRPEHVHAS